MAAKQNKVVPLKPGKTNHQGEGGGHPRAFKTSDDLLDAFLSYTDYVVDNDYIEVPTKGNFAKWCGIDRKTIYNTINKYFPDRKKDYKEILAEILTTGAMMGKWDRTITIFALKNWCDWSDKREDRVVNDSKVSIATREQAKEALNNLKDLHVL